MAMVLQANRATSNDNSTGTMDSYQQLHHSANQEDSLHRKILNKVEEGKRTKDPKECQQILDDLMKTLKHMTADVNNYNMTFGESQPPFYMQEFQRLTDSIEILTKARDIITEYLHELEGRNPVKPIPCSSSVNDVVSMNTQRQPSITYSPTTSHITRSSPPEKHQRQHTSSTSSIHSDSSQRPRSPSMVPNNFIRVHLPNKHTTALAVHNDETLEAALKLPASRHSVTNLRAYTPVYMISRQPCPWDITLDRLQEAEIELEETPKLDHSFEDIPAPHFLRRISVRCVVCRHRIGEAYKRCVSCGNTYHNSCRLKAPVCSHPILQYIKHLKPDRFDLNQRRSQSQNKEQSRSLPRFPLPLQRPRIDTSQGVDPQKDVRQNSCNNQWPISNVGYVIADERQSTMSISSNSHFHRASSVMSSSLPSTTSPIHHIPQLILTTHDPTVASPENPPSIVRKPNSDVINDQRRPHPHKYVSEWEIPPEDLVNHGRMVGRGTYGTVYKAEVRLHGEVALKELNFVSPTETQFQAFRNEVLALKKITHQNTLNFYGYMSSPRFAIVTQWCEGSTLYKHIHIYDRHWNVNQLTDIARQICQGMSYLHDREIIHRDLKSSNVFLDMSNEPDDSGLNIHVKIGDFGLAAVKTVLTEGVLQQSQPSGSVLWMAPEVIQQKDANCYSTRSDVYAYGCVLFEMFSGKLPHAPICNKEQIMWLVGKGRLKLKVEQCRDDTPKSIVQLIRQCTDFHRDQRPNFSPEIDDTLSKFEFKISRFQRSQSEPCLIRNPQDDLLGLSMNFGVPKTPASSHRRFNAEAS